MPIVLPTPVAVLYDWDNTLVDTWDTIVGGVNHTLTAFGFSAWGPEEARARIQKSLRDSFPAQFGARWTEARDVYYQWIAAHHIERLKALPGAIDLLRLFASRGVYQAVVSNKGGHFLRAEIHALGWQCYFGMVVGSGDAPRDKPCVEAVAAALAPAGIPQGPDVWFLGDAEVDMECAHTGGLTPIGIGLVETEKNTKFPAVAHFKSCQALCGLVDISNATISVPDNTEPVRISPERTA